MIHNSFSTLSSMDRELYDAGAMGDLDFISKLSLDYLGQLTPQKNTILHIAITFKQKDFASKLIEFCPWFLAHANTDGNTPLHVAAKIGCPEITQLLIDHKANAICHYLEHQASHHGCDNNVLEALPSSLLRMVNKAGDTALHVAVRNGHFGVVDLLMEADVELATLSNYARETPIFLAVEGGFFEICRHILHKCPLPLPNRGTHGMTALHAALIRTHPGQELENQVPDLSLENIRRIIRDSLLDLQGRIGRFRSHQIDIIKELLDKWRDMVKEVDDQKWTPLHYAAQLGHREATYYFLKADRSVAYLQNKEGLSAFHLAAKEGHVKIMDEFMNHCPDVCELTDNEGRTALHLAVTSGKARAVKYILNNKKLEDLINFPCEKGNTPLHLAAFHGRYNILMTLAYDPRVDKKAVNKDYLKAIDIIQSNTDMGELNKTRVMKKLEQAGGRQSLRRVISKDKELYSQNSWETPRNETKQFQSSKRDLSPLVHNRNSNTTAKVFEFDKDKSSRTDRLKGISGTHLLVAALIATVTFTSGLSVPGGYDDKGNAALASKVSFRVFLIANGLAFYCSTVSVLLHFLASVEHNYHLLLRFTRFAAALTYISIIALVIAFTSGMHGILFESSGFSRAVLAIGCCFLGFCLFGFL